MDEKYIDMNYVLNRVRDGLTVRQIADELGINRTTLHRKLNKIGFYGIHKLRFNHDYFENIDSQEKAYWLGFIAADGCVTHDLKGSPRLVIVASSIDHEHLLKWHKAIYSKNNLIKTKDDCLHSVHQSRKMTSDLIKLGITPRKSLTLQFPELQAELIRHFIRGYMDGDGCISFQDKEYKTWTINVSFAGTLNMMNTIRDHLNSNVKFRKVGDNTYTFKIAGNNKAIKILDWLYKGATIYLDRKYKLYKEHKAKLLECPRKHK